MKESMKPLCNPMSEEVPAATLRSVLSFRAQRLSPVFNVTLCHEPSEAYRSTSDSYSLTLKRASDCHDCVSQLQNDTIYRQMDAAHVLHYCICCGLWRSIVLFKLALISPEPSSPLISVCALSGYMQNIITIHD